MGSFSASLKTVGDRHGLKATVSVEGGRLSIAAGDAAIGEWPLDEIKLEPVPTGYRLAAEGEQILIEMRNIDEFADVLSQESKQGSILDNFKLPGFGSRKKAEEKTETPTRSQPEPVSQNHSRPVVAESTQKVAPAHEAPRRERRAKGEKEAKEREENAVIAFVDRTLAKAEKRWSSLLPAWVFTRATFWIVVVTLISAVIFPGVVSTFLLLGGVLLVTFGAIVYSDGMLASRWLPGRTTPIHVLLFGVAILMIGVLLAVIAN